jgi:hypothetical protein
LKLSRRAAVAAIAATAALAASAGAAQAVTWTGIDSTTAEEISAVEYHPSGKIWFATTNGKIFSRPAGGSFAPNEVDPGTVFTDIAFRAAGDVGLATAYGGQLYKTTNGGATWSSATVTTFNHACPFTPSGTYGSVPAGDLLAVAWSSDNVAWVIGDGRAEVFKYTHASGTTTDASKTNTGTCRLNAEVTDVAPVPGSEDAVYYVDNYFAGVWHTSNGLASVAAKRGELVNCGGLMSLAVDPASPNRISAGGDCTHFLHWGFSSNGGTNRNYVYEGSTAPIRDLDAGAGVFLAVGDGGLIEQTFDGATANPQPASGSLATANWKTVDFADAARAVVGGTGGALAITDQANVPPAVPPIPGPTPRPTPTPTPDVRTPTVGGTTVGRKTLTPGQGTTFGFNSNEAGMAVLTFEKRFAGLKGKRKGKRVCMPKTKKRLRALRKQAGGKQAYAKLLRKKSCQGYQRIGAIRQQVRAGRNTIAFNGRVAGRKLGKGRYRAKLAITDAAGNTSRAETIKFKVVAKKKKARR